MFTLGSNGIKDITMSQFTSMFKGNDGWSAIKINRIIQNKKIKFVP